MNDLLSHQALLDALTPWSGYVPPAHVANLFGVLTHVRFQPLSGIEPSAVGGGHVDVKLPQLIDGGRSEWWFETVNWLGAAREARERFVMVSLGAQFGGQLVGAHHALQRTNPLPSLLVGVEPEPGNFAWMIEHFRANAIDPAEHWLLPLAIAGMADPVLFPVGGPGTGANNCVATNEAVAREQYVRELTVAGKAESALRSVLLDNTTGLRRALLPDGGYQAEIKFVSAITLSELLGPLARVDYLEADIQQSEILVSPPFLGLLRKKVHRIHIGTHGSDVHATLHALFEQDGWRIIFSYPPNGRFETAIGAIQTNDGVLTVLNPDL